MPDHCGGSAPAAVCLLKSKGYLREMRDEIEAVLSEVQKVIIGKRGVA